MKLPIGSNMATDMAPKPNFFQTKVPKELTNMEPLLDSRAKTLSEESNGLCDATTTHETQLLTWTTNLSCPTREVWCFSVLGSGDGCLEEGIGEIIVGLPLYGTIQRGTRVSRGAHGTRC